MIAALLAAIICTCGVPGPAEGPYQPAVRLTTPTTTVAPWPTGIYNLPFAPFGLTDCQEMRFYANQFGLPLAFDAIGWRESNCRNEDIVHTSCCWGYWQMDEDHFPIPECDAWSSRDVDSDNPLDKQRQACSAKQLYDRDGMSPWRLR